MPTPSDNVKPFENPFAIASLINHYAHSAGPMLNTPFNRYAHPTGPIVNKQFYSTFDTRYKKKKYFLEFLSLSISVPWDHRHVVERSIWNRIH